MVKRDRASATEGFQNFVHLAKKLVRWKILEQMNRWNHRNKEKYIDSYQWFVFVIEIEVWVEIQIKIIIIIIITGRQHLLSTTVESSWFNGPLLLMSLVDNMIVDHHSDVDSSEDEDGLLHQATDDRLNALYRFDHSQKTCLISSCKRRYFSIILVDYLIVKIVQSWLWSVYKCGSYKRRTHVFLQESIWSNNYSWSWFQLGLPKYFMCFRF